MSAEIKAPMKLSDELDELRPEIEKVLPVQVTVDKFMRVVYTAIAQNVSLRNADRRSLLTSAIKAAQDGLLPDGREAAFVIFNSKEKFRENGKMMERWIEKVQYMPMVNGIIKKLNQTGELKQISVNIVREGDTFRYWVDDHGEHILHEPLLGTNGRQATAAYARATMHGGGVYLEIMSRFEIEQVRAISKSKDKGPWVEWWEEMAKKTVIRRMSKRMPMSTDVVQVLHRDDEMYDLSQRTRRASSGTAAAREMLGLTHKEPDELLQQSVPEEREVVVEHVEEEKPAPQAQATPASNQSMSEEALNKATTVDALDEAMETISTLYAASKRKVPEETTALYRRRREEFLSGGDE